MKQQIPRLALQDYNSSCKSGPSQQRNPSIKIQPPSHLRWIAQWLLRFPSEILIYYPVFEGIPLRSILLLSGSVTDTAKLDRCITEIKEYQLVFPSMEQLANVRNTYLFLYELRVIKGFPATTPYTSALACTAGELATWKPPNFRALQIYLDVAIQRILTGAEDIYDNSPLHDLELRRQKLRDYLEAQDLKHWDEQPINFSISQIKSAPSWARNMYTPSYFEHMEKSAIVLRHEQLAWMADLVEMYPDILKRAADPHPEPRPNWKHSVNYLRVLASELTKDVRERYRWVPYLKENVGPAFFCSDVFPLVPSDKTLAFFIAGVTKLLPVLPAWLAIVVSPSVFIDSGYRLSQTSSSVRLFASPFAKLCLQVDKSLYPPNVLNDIKTAVEGMALIHTLPTGEFKHKPRILRTRWTPWSAEPYRQPFDTSLKHDPVFMSPPLLHLDILSPEKLDKRCIWFYIQNDREVHPLEEFEWLHAFCRTVRFLERIELGGNPAYEYALERQKRIDQRIEMDREWRRIRRLAI